MTKPSQKTHGRRKLRVTLPSGRRTYHFQPRVHGVAQCAQCGRQLHGVITNRPQGHASSSRAPSRPYAGILCPNCLASGVRSLVRASGTDE